MLELQRRSARPQLGPRVREGAGGIILLEWREPVVDEESHPVRDPETGAPIERRRRTSTGHRDRTKAKRQAQELADRFDKMVATPPSSLSGASSTSTSRR